jgi:hypothetical protein
VHIWQKWTFGQKSFKQPLFSGTFLLFGMEGMGLAIYKVLELAYMWPLQLAALFTMRPHGKNLLHF